MFDWKSIFMSFFLPISLLFLLVLRQYSDIAIYTHSYHARHATIYRIFSLSPLELNIFSREFIWREIVGTFRTFILLSRIYESSHSNFFSSSFIARVWTLNDEENELSFLDCAFQLEWKKHELKFRWNFECVVCERRMLNVRLACLYCFFFEVAFCLQARKLRSTFKSLSMRWKVFN